MLYMSNDRKYVFETEQECCEYENAEKRRLEEEKRRKEKLEIERKDRLNIIKKKYEELQSLISEYGREYGTTREVYFSPIHEIVNMLCE